MHEVAVRSVVDVGVAFEPGRAAWTEHQLGEQVGRHGRDVVISRPRRPSSPRTASQAPPASSRPTRDRYSDSITDPCVGVRATRPGAATAPGAGGRAAPPDRRPGRTATGGPASGSSPTPAPPRTPSPAARARSSGPRVQPAGVDDQCPRPRPRWWPPHGPGGHDPPRTATRAVAADGSVALGHDHGGMRQVEEDRPDLVREAHLQCRRALHDRLERTDRRRDRAVVAAHLPALGGATGCVGRDEPTPRATNGVLVAELAVEEADAGHDLDQVAALHPTTARPARTGGAPALDRERPDRSRTNSGWPTGTDRPAMSKRAESSPTVDTTRDAVDCHRVRPRPDLRRSERGRRPPPRHRHRSTWR